MNSKVRAVIDVMDLYQSTYVEDVCIIVFDLEKVIGYKPGKNLNLQIQLGDSIKKYSHTTSVRAMRNRSVLREECNDKLFDFPYITSSVPIYDENNVVGVVTSIIANDRYTHAHEAAYELTSTVQEITVTNKLLASTSVDVSKSIEELSQFAESLQENIQQINSIVGSVKSIAMRSKILGLNASIEASRAGAHGKGFAVVAKEIQIMGENSKDSANNIEQQIEQIKSAIHFINNSTNQISVFTQQYSSSLLELKDNYAKLNTIGQTLLELSTIKYNK